MVYTIVGRESRSYTGLALIIAGMYGVLFSFLRPIQDAFENQLMATCRVVVNLATGAMSKIPLENIPESNDS